MSEAPSTRMEREMFEEWRPDPRATVPLDAYQQFTVRRVHYKGGDQHDVDRFQLLMFYIEHYSFHRKPFRAPFSGRQIKWLLESESAALDPRPFARVVEYFLHRSDLPGPYATPEGYLRVAYWWSVEKAAILNVEHALVPDGFIGVLATVIRGSSGNVPVTEFLHRYLHANGLGALPLHTEAQKLAAYLLVLTRMGVHAALFFPESVLSRLAAFSDAGAALAGDPGQSARVRDLVDKARAYRRRHARIRKGLEDTSAARLGLDYTALKWERPPGAPLVHPRPKTPGWALPVPVRVVGPLNSRAGLGQAARLSVQALRAANVDVQTLDFPMDMPAPRAFYYPNDDIRPADFAINLLHLNAENVPLATAYLTPELFTNTYNIGYFFWEIPTPAVCQELALKQLDEVWVSSRFNQEVYAPWTPKPVSCVGMAVAQGPSSESFDRAAARARWELPAHDTVFITTFDSYSYILRKNPTATIRAFLDAFPLGTEPVTLVVKTHNLFADLGETNAESYRSDIVNLCASDDRIRLINETLPHEELMQLKAACDVYVSLHRSEGWGFGMLEAMQLGLPVIATDFSGNADFCLDDTAWRVPWSKRLLREADYIFVRPGDWWAEPDVAAAADAMREAAAHPERVRAKGERARAFVAETYSPTAIGARYLSRLQAIVAARG
ncbi:MAG: glycosyltransferase [Caulobacteraceae bacterium]|nr:glycosyltransferase [Caulobacter sp.]